MQKAKSREGKGLHWHPLQEGKQLIRQSSERGTQRVAPPCGGKGLPSSSRGDRAGVVDTLLALVHVALWAPFEDNYLLSLEGALNKRLKKRGDLTIATSPHMVAATSSSGPAAAATAGPSPATDKVSVFTCVREALSGTVAVLQEAPLAVATETTGLMQEVPLVGIVCKTFLSFEKLVDTARSNKENLAVLRDLCDVVIKGVLDKRSDRSVLLKGFKALEKHTKRAKEVAKLCNGRVKPFLLASKICKEIAAVRKDVLDFLTANELVLANELHVSVVGYDTTTMYLCPSILLLYLFRTHMSSVSLVGVDRGTLYARLAAVAGAKAASVETRRERIAYHTYESIAREFWHIYLL